MKQVVDERKVPVRGLFRDGIGLVVQDPDEYDKYIIQRDAILAKDKKIADLENKINQLFELLNDKHVQERSPS